MKVFDINILREEVDRDDPLTAGWCFGLPPGIRPDQWPLDPRNGYPLVHGFTVSIPDEYRRHGRDLVALSFFGTSEDMDVGQGGPFIEESIAATFRTDAAKPEDPDLMPFWLAARHAHPRLYRFGGEDFASYAAILLTQTEYDGGLCPPPTCAANRFRERIDPPAWLQLGAASAAVQTANDNKLLEILGAQPDANLSFNRALRFEIRFDDPNAGKAPRSRSSTKQTGYNIGFHEGLDGQHQLFDWAHRIAWLHFGGTMRPGQRIPEFSTYYMEFEQYLGGFNFGDGTAQIDLESMSFNIMTL